MATAWSSTDRNPAHIVQVSAREVNNPDPGGWYGIRTTTSKNDDQTYYFEVQFKVNNGNAVILGIVNAAQNYSDYPGANGSVSVGYWNNGGRFLGGNSSGSTGSPADGDTGRFLVNFLTKQVQVALNDGPFSAVCDFSSITSGPYYLMASFNTGPAAVVAAWAAADFKYPIPSGAVSWDDGVAGSDPEPEPEPDPGPSTGGDYTIPDGYRLYDPAVDLDAVGFLFDVLTPSTLTFNGDKTKVSAVKSRVGSAVLKPGSSGIPRYQDTNGLKALYGDYDYAYYKTQFTGFPPGGQPLGLFFVGKSTGGYNSSATILDATDTNRNLLGIGTVGGNEIGSPLGGQDLGTGVLYSTVGNMVLAQADGADPQNITIYSAGKTLASRTRPSTVGKQPGWFSILGNSDSKTEAAFFYTAIGLIRALTAKEIQDLNGWAAWRTNMVDQLPANSPWLKGPPIVADSTAVTPKAKRRKWFLLA